MGAFKKWFSIAAAAAGLFGGGVLTGKNLQPAKVSVSESSSAQSSADKQASESKGSKSDESNDKMLLKNRTKVVDTKANGDKIELTIEEFLSLTAARKFMEDIQSSHSAEHSESQSQASKITETINSAAYVRMGFITPVQENGKMDFENLKSSELLGTASYGNWEGVTHSDLKGSGWIGLTWGLQIP